MCVKFVIYKDHTGMHVQQNIKLLKSLKVVLSTEGVQRSLTQQISNFISIFVICCKQGW